MYDVPVHNSVTGAINDMISHGLHAGEMSQAATILSCSPGLTAFFPFHFLHGVLRDIAGDVWVRSCGKSHSQAAWNEAQPVDTTCKELPFCFLPRLSLRPGHLVCIPSGVQEA